MGLSVMKGEKIREERRGIEASSILYTLLLAVINFYRSQAALLFPHAYLLELSRQPQLPALAKPYDARMNYDTYETPWVISAEKDFLYTSNAWNSMPQEQLELPW